MARTALFEANNNIAIANVPKKANKLRNIVKFVESDCAKIKGFHIYGKSFNKYLTISPI